MTKTHKIIDLKFENDYLFIVVDDKTSRIKLIDISEKLYNASMQQRYDFKISPSGYGIHWPQIDEDLSINGLFL